MTLHDRDLRALWRGREPPSDAPTSACLTEEDWPRLLSGDADAAERTRAARHVAVCASCAGEYRALRALRPWAEDAAQALEPPGARAWAWPSLAGRWPVPAMAAALLLAVASGVALVWLTAGARRDVARLEARLAEQDTALASAAASLREQEQRRLAADREAADLRASLAEIADPELGTPIIDLDALPDTRSAAGRAPAVVELPRDARFVTLILNFPPQPAGATLVVDLVDARGERVWTRETRTTRVTASVNLTLSRRSVPPGRYAIHVAARTGGTPAPVARYDVQIRHADEGTAR